MVSVGRFPFWVCFELIFNSVVYLLDLLLLGIVYYFINGFTWVQCLVMVLVWLFDWLLFRLAF